MTDTDFRERAALLAVWPSMRLLLCTYHVSTCWANQLNNALKGGGSRLVIDFRRQVKKEIQEFLQRIKVREAEIDIVREVDELENKLKVILFRLS